jgi:drug/metabolite transporter (DMT)-like permease
MVWPTLALLFNAAVWGLSWWPLRLLRDMGVHPLWANVGLFSIGCAVLLLWRPQALGQVRRTPVLWAMALASGGVNAAFNWGVSIGEVVRVVLLFYLMPVWTALLAWLWLGERPGLGGLLRVGLALGGAALVLQPEGGAWPLPRGLADVLGLLGGLGFACNSVLVRRYAPITRDEGRALAMLMGCVGVSLVLALALGPLAGGHWVPALPPARPLWIALLGLTALAFLAGNLAYQHGASKLPANVTAVVMLTEVVFAALSAVWIGAEPLSGRTLLGGGLIVMAALLATLAPARVGRGAQPAAKANRRTSASSSASS